MCTRFVYLLKRLDRTGALEIAPFQEPGTAERLGISPSRMAESGWWLDSSGAVYGGAEAVNAALSAALGTRLPLCFYRLPGSGALQERRVPLGGRAPISIPGDHPVLRIAPGAC